jgi:hypothetical protein
MTRCEHSAQSWEYERYRVRCDDCQGYIQQSPQDGFWYRVEDALKEAAPASVWDRLLRDDP